MEELRGHDRYLDPPDEPVMSPCSHCGEMFKSCVLNRIKADDLWLCDECADDYENREPEA